jgi:hypothetical protein
MMVKNKKHDKLVSSYEKQKQNHLEKLATKQLKSKDKIDNLKTKYVDGDFLKLF